MVRVVSLQRRHDVGVEELEAAKVVDEDETERGQHQGCGRARVEASPSILAMDRRCGVKGRPVSRKNQTMMGARPASRTTEIPNWLSGLLRCSSVPGWLSGFPWFPQLTRMR